ncbi:MAG TPA: hypothetical protein ENL37_01335 [Desulfobacteraceae bacterium]|nr:hypothetical protein [Desulfobacteraceae bacterium]
MNISPQLFFLPKIIILSVSMNAKKVHIKSFGCQMNKLDSSLITNALKDKGYETTQTINKLKTTNNPKLSSKITLGNHQ